MSIKEGSKRASAKSNKRGRVAGYVVPEDAIREFIESIGVRDISTVAARLQTVADLTEVALDIGIVTLDESVLQRIKEIARESDDKHYCRIMSSIIDCVGNGGVGIDAAHAIASRAVQLAFRWTPDYRAALDLYTEKLRLNEAGGRPPVVNNRGVTLILPI